MEPQLFGSCAYMITAQHKGHIKLHWPVIPGDLQHFKGIFTLLLKPKTMNPFFLWSGLKCVVLADKLICTAAHVFVC